MKNKIKKVLNNKKTICIIVLLMFLFLIFETFHLFYTLTLLKNVANELRFLIKIIILFICFIFVHLGLSILLKNKKNRYKPLILFMFMYIIILTFSSSIAHNWYSKISNISTDTNIQSVSLVTLKDNNIKDIKNILKEDKIGIINNEEIYIQNELIEKNNLVNQTVNYDDYGLLLQDLVDSKVKYAILPENYEITFSSLEEIDINNIKSIYTYSKEINIEVNQEKVLDKPFTVLLMGVDSKVSDIKKASLNGDSLMVVTFNPNTLNATILSIPRDTYTEISCFKGNRKNKITHSAWYGESCVEKTIENLIGIEIDYYVKIDFKGLVDLVDAVGGIEVDVPIKFCEQDSDRNFKNLICLNKGKQTLNGEQALALSRHRKTINDFVRGQNQQLVLKALIEKLIKIRNINKVSDILDALKSNLETNITTNQIFSLYDVGIKALDLSKTKGKFNMQRLYISGYDQYIYDYSNLYNAGTKLNLYNFIPYEGSIKDVNKAMKINLELEKEEEIKKLDFDINEPYKEKIIGKGNYNATNKIKLLPNFIGKNVSEVNAYGNLNGIKINIEEIHGSSSNFIGEVINQEPHSNIDMEYMDKNKGITVTIVTSIPQINLDDGQIEETKDEDDITIDNNE